ncbi:stress response protein NST1-like [Nicotiana tomentosiformis]|uniref:stress response protein NST1-like n=1 Tax=Nicotiana tomentosiformis TaxID=4098 RepID=UPI00388C5E3E
MVLGGFQRKLKERNLERKEMEGIEKKGNWGEERKKMRSENRKSGKREKGEKTRERKGRKKQKRFGYVYGGKHKHLICLSKDVALRPPSGGKNFPAESPVPRHGGEMKRKRAPISPRSEKKKPRRRLMRKSKESTSARAPYLDSLYLLRNESEEEQEEEAFNLVARVSLRLEGQGASEPKRDEVDLPQV